MFSFLTRNKLLTGHLAGRYKPARAFRTMACPPRISNQPSQTPFAFHPWVSPAAQCVSAIAAIELPVGKWPELIPQLLEFVQNQDNTGLRVNTLQAVGYICEVIVSYHDPSDILSSTDIHIAT